MSCTQCGAQLYEGQRFCGNCGARVSEAEAARPDTTAEADPSTGDRPAWPSPQPAATTRATNKPAVIAAIVALIAIAAGAGAYFLTIRPSGKQELARWDEPAAGSTEKSEPAGSLPPAKEEDSSSKKTVAPKKPAASRTKPSSPPVASRRTVTAGTYETVRDTSVHESPTSSSKVVSSIPRGYTVEVVSSTGNWLEVRSKSGNPPGFIRRSDALPVPKRG